MLELDANDPFVPVSDREMDRAAWRSGRGGNYECTICNKTKWFTVPYVKQLLKKDMPPVCKNKKCHKKWRFSY